MWYLELALKSMNLNPYGPEVPEDLLRKFTSLRSMLASQSLALQLNAVVERKALFSKSVAMLALKHGWASHKRQELTLSSAQVFQSLVSNLLNRSYVHRRGKALKTISDLALKADSHRSFEKSRLFALKYFSNSLNRSFLDFYKRLKDNRTEKLAGIRIALAAMKIANRAKQFRALDSLKANCLAEKGSFAAGEQLKTRLPRLLVARQNARLEKALARLIGKKTETQVRTTGFQSLCGLIKRRLGDPFARLKGSSAASLAQMAFDRELILYRLKYSTLSKLKSVLTFLTTQPPVPAKRSPLLSLHQLRFAQATKLLHSFQRLKNPNFLKKQIMGGLHKLADLSRAHRLMNGQRFLNILCRDSALRLSRFHRLVRVLNKLFESRLTKGFLALKDISDFTLDHLFAAQRLGRIPFQPADQPVDSLLLPCFTKLLGLLHSPQHEREWGNTIGKFDRYIAMRKEFESKRSHFAMQRAQCKFEIVKVRAESKQLEGRNQFLEMSVQNLICDNRRLQQNQMDTSADSTRITESFNSAQLELNSLQQELDRLKNDHCLVKSERLHLLEEIRQATEEYFSRPVDRNMNQVGEAETNMPPKSSSQVNVFQTGVLPASINRGDRTTIPHSPARPTPDVSGDDSLNNKYSLKEDHVRINAKYLQSNPVVIRNDNSCQRQLVKEQSEERVQLESKLQGLSEIQEQQQIRHQEVLSREDQLRDRLQNLEEKLVAAEMHLIDLQDKRGMVILEKTASRKNNEKVKKNMDDLKRQMQSIEQANDGSEESLAKLEQLRAAHGQAFEALKNNAIKVAGLEKKISELADAQKDIIGSVAELKAEKQTCEQAVEAAGEECKQVETEIKRLEREVTVLRERISSLPNELDESESQPFAFHFRDKRTTTDSNNMMGEAVMKDLRTQVRQAEEAIEKKEDEKGALIMQKLFMQKQKKKLATDLQGLQTKLRRAEAESTIDPEMVAAKERIQKQLETLDLGVRENESKIAGFVSELEVLRQGANKLKTELENLERNGPNETFLSKDMLVTMRNPTHFINDRPFPTAEGIPRDSGQNFTSKVDRSCLSGLEFRKAPGERIFELAKELSESAGRWDRQRQTVLSLKQQIKEKRTAAEALKFQSEVSGFKKLDRENLFKTNNCLIIDMREEQFANDKQIAANRQRLHALTLTLRTLDQKLADLQTEPAFPKLIKSVAAETQTEAAEPVLPVSLVLDKADGLHRGQRHFLLSPDFDVLQKLLPSKHNHAVSSPQNYFVVKVTSAMNSNSFLAEIENNYSFDENGFKFIRRDTADQKDDVEISGDYEDYFSQGDKEDVDLEVDHKSSLPAQYEGTYEFDGVRTEIDFEPRRELPAPPIAKPRPKPRDTQSVAIFRRDHDLQGRTQNRLTPMILALRGLIHSRLSNAFNDFRMVCSKQQVKRFMMALYNWRLANLDANSEKLRQQSKNFKQGLFVLLHFATQRQKQKTFGMIGLASGLQRQRQLNNLLPVVVRANMAQRKNLKDILHYWFSIKDENKWFAKTIKGLVFKSSLHPQVALWRLRLFRRQLSPVPPQVTKGLLFFMDWVQDKQLDNTSRCFFKLTSLLPNDQFSSLPRSHISETLNEEMSGENSLDDDMHNNSFSADEDEELEQLEKQRTQNKLRRQFMATVARYKKLSLRFFHLLQRKATEQRQGKSQTGAAVAVARKSKDPNAHYLQNLQFIFEQNLKCRQELSQKETQIVTLRSELEQKQNDLMLLRNNFTFVFLDKIERICARHQRLGMGQSLRRFFTRLSQKHINNQFKY